MEKHYFEAEGLTMKELYEVAENITVKELWSNGFRYQGKSTKGDIVLSNHYYIEAEVRTEERRNSPRVRAGLAQIRLLVPENFPPEQLPLMLSKLLKTNIEPIKKLELVH